MFSLKSISVRTHDTSFGGYPYRADVTIQMPSQDFNKIKKQGQLGSLYLDVSNATYRASRELIPAYQPMVDDTRRASKGIKTIHLTYFFKDHDTAEALGLEVLRLKNGEAYPSYGAYASILEAV